MALLRSGGITGWEANVPIRDHEGLIGVGDIVFRRAKVVIEVDGWAFHVSPAAFQRDRARQNRLVAAGWTVLRFTCVTSPSDRLWSSGPYETWLGSPKKRTQ